MRFMKTKMISIGLKVKSLENKIMIRMFGNLRFEQHL